ncbi:uncharacterized protein SPSK_03331 [Sporothrix schenckii 1099-18]|uniref:Secreted protein n=1 Tax=Sporothrix schenckii 1099-18 TaxID=1397361 RepID=A0A0F2LYG9_SPOSC|nr:uncharacterized protein SPSK_03331 [Sporothrix schenckii 1099-18]KJR82498.1 hypothetical protein SPSK_03331 [Sporothrix schenckii 1099-18]
MADRVVVLLLATTMVAMDVASTPRQTLNVRIHHRIRHTSTLVLPPGLHISVHFEQPRKASTRTRLFLGTDALALLRLRLRSWRRYNGQVAHIERHHAAQPQHFWTCGIRRAGHDGIHAAGQVVELLERGMPDVFACQPVGMVAPTATPVAIAVVAVCVWTVAVLVGVRVRVRPAAILAVAVRRPFSRLSLLPSLLRLGIQALIRQLHLCVDVVQLGAGQCRPKRQRVHGPWKQPVVRVLLDQVLVESTNRRHIGRRAPATGTSLVAFVFALPHEKLGAHGPHVVLAQIHAPALDVGAQKQPKCALGPSQPNRRRQLACFARGRRHARQRAVRGLLQSPLHDCRQHADVVVVGTLHAECIAAAAGLTTTEPALLDGKACCVFSWIAASAAAAATTTVVVVLCRVVQARIGMDGAIFVFSIIVRVCVNVVLVVAAVAFEPESRSKPMLVFVRLGIVHCVATDTIRQRPVGETFDIVGRQTI